jgi:hypothetical protein
VAKVFGAFRVTGQVSDGVARDLLAQLRSFKDASEAAGVEVKGSVDTTGLAPEPVVAPVVSEPVPEVAAPVELEKPAEKIESRKPGKGAK